MAQRIIIRFTKILIAGPIKIVICNLMRVYKLNVIAINRMIASHNSTWLVACVHAWNDDFKSVDIYTVVIFIFSSALRFLMVEQDT